MRLFILERCVSRCALFFVCSIFLVSVTLLVVSLFIRHPNECLKNPSEGLDAEGSTLGAKLRQYRLFSEFTTWQPKFSKVSTAFVAEQDQPNRAPLIEFTSSKKAAPSSREVTPASGWSKPRRLIDVAACSGWSDRLIAKNSLPLAFRSANNDDLLSPQSVWALCQLAERIERNQHYGAICRRRPRTNEEGEYYPGSDDAISRFTSAVSLPDESSDELMTTSSVSSTGDDHPTNELGECCPVISIHTFIQQVFPLQDPCQQLSKVSLSQTETLRQDIFFCQRAAHDPRFMNETYPFCNDFRPQIGSFMTFLADKHFLRESQSVMFSNIWLPLKDESESHDTGASAHDLEMVEKLVNGLREENTTSKFNLLFQLPKNPNVINSQKRRKMLEFQSEFMNSLESVAEIGVSVGLGFVFLILATHFSVIRVFGILFAYFCIFAIGYFSMFVAYGQQPTFIGILVPSIVVLLLTFDAFFVFNTSMTDAAERVFKATGASAASDPRTFQQVLLNTIRVSMPPMTHLTLLQSSLTFALVGFCVGDITGAQATCHFAAMLSGAAFLVLSVWLPSNCALSFRNKQNVNIPLAEVNQDGDDVHLKPCCCVKVEKGTQRLKRRLLLAMTPAADKLTDALTFMILRFNAGFCLVPLLILSLSLAALFYFGVALDASSTDSSLSALFTLPLTSFSLTPSMFFLNKPSTIFAYEDEKEKYRALLKDTNRTDVDPFYDCNNQFQRISFVFRVDHGQPNEDVLFSRETQVWFRRFCNESKHWLEQGGGGGDTGRSRVSVHPLRECSIDRLLPYFESRQCTAMREHEGREVTHDVSPCCDQFKFPWDPAVYKQCLRQYVIDQIFKTGTEPNIDLRFSKDGTAETGFAVEYDVTFLAPGAGSRFGNQTTPASSLAPNATISCAKMGEFYERAVEWFDNALLSAPYQLRGSSSIFVVSPQLTGQNMRLTLAKTLLFGLLGCMAFATLGALVGTFNLMQTVFSFVAIFCGAIMAGSALIALYWKIGILEDILLATLLVPLTARGCLLVGISFRQNFYRALEDLRPPQPLSPHQNNCDDPGLPKRPSTEFVVEPVTRATVRHSFSVLFRSLVMTSAIAGPLLFCQFLFARRLAQFLIVANAASFFVALFCLVPMLSRFAFVARRFGFGTPSLDKRRRRHHHRPNHQHQHQQQSSLSASPKSSTTSGPPSHSTEEDQLPVMLPTSNSRASKSTLLAAVDLTKHQAHPTSCSNNRKAAMTPMVDLKKIMGSSFSKSHGQLPLADDDPNGELIWVPRFPAAGVALEEFRIMTPSPDSGHNGFDDGDIQPPRMCYLSTASAGLMSTSWSANSSSFGVVHASNQRHQHQHIEAPPIVAKKPSPPTIITNNKPSGTGTMSGSNSHHSASMAMTAGRPPGHSKSFHGAAACDSFLVAANSNSNNNGSTGHYLYSPSYHTIGGNVSLIGGGRNSSSQLTQ